MTGQGGEEKGGGVKTFFEVVTLARTIQAVHSMMVTKLHDKSAVSRV